MKHTKLLLVSLALNFAALATIVYQVRVSNPWTKAGGIAMYDSKRVLFSIADDAKWWMTRIPIRKKVYEVSSGEGACILFDDQVFRILLDESGLVKGFLRTDQLSGKSIYTQITR